VNASLSAIDPGLGEVGRNLKMHLLTAMVAVSRRQTDASFADRLFVNDIYRTAPFNRWGLTGN